MYNHRVLKNGRIKIENSRRNKSAIFDRQKRAVIFNSGIPESEINKAREYYK